MSGVLTLTVSSEDGEQRLDRWFKRRFPQITQGAVEKMCRTGQVRVDGARAKAADRVIRLARKRGSSPPSSIRANQ